MQYKVINGVQTYAPASRKDLIHYAGQGNKILVAVNAEKILHANEDSRNIINRNLGYPDGIGAVMALKKKGIKQVSKIPGCELWLDIIAAYYNDKSFYLVGGKEEVIQETVNELKKQFPGINILNYRNGYVKTELETLLLVNQMLYLLQWVPQNRNC